MSTRTKYPAAIIVLRETPRSDDPFLSAFESASEIPCDHHGEEVAIYQLVETRRFDVSKVLMARKMK